MYLKKLQVRYKGCLLYTSTKIKGGHTGRKAGYVNENGEEVIPPIYDMVDVYKRQVFRDGSSATYIVKVGWADSLSKHRKGLSELENIRFGQSLFVCPAKEVDISNCFYCIPSWCAKARNCFSISRKGCSSRSVSYTHLEESLPDMLREIRNALGEIPLIFTIRTVSEGGNRCV